MKQMNLKKGMSVGLLIAMISTGCGPTVLDSSKGSDSSPSDKPISSTTVPPVVVEDVTPNGVELVLADDRVLAYQSYTKDGVAKKQYSSLYNAIADVVDSADFDLDSYITKIDGEDKGVKLFTKKDKFAADSEDMFYFYQNGNQLATYTGWNGTYWEDLRELGDATSVYVSPKNGCTPYFNSYELAGVSSTDEAAKNTQYWNVTQDIETNILVNPASYSGITKETYKLNLKDAKIAPSKDASQKTNAFVGFVTADTYNVSNQGLMCDTATGDFYYYAGETPFDANTIQIKKDKCLLTSTWNEAGKYFVPDENVEMTLEILTLKDANLNDYVINRLTMNFESGRKVVRDYKMAKLTQCGTVRFTAGLDIKTTTTQADYMNGSYFKGLTITDAKGYVDPSVADPINYGGKIASLDAGTYDLLNSNPESLARFQTIIYNSGMINQDYSVASKDVYNFEYTASVTNSALGNDIVSTNKKLAALPEVSTVTLETKPQIVAARNALNGLEAGEREYINVDGITKLEACENKIIDLENPGLGELVGKIKALGTLR